MRLTKVITAAVTAAALSSVPVMAQAAQAPAASKLAQISGKNVRAGAKVDRESQARGRGGSLILLLLALAAAGAGLYFALDGNSDPQSP